MNFNKTQLDVINCNSHALVFASAGTGKTSTLVEKIRVLLKQNQIDPSRILCLTFTNRGCEEIKNKITEELGDECSKKLTVKTFHAFCYQLINEYKIFAHLEIEDSLIYDEDDCKFICQDIIDEMGLKLSFKDNPTGLQQLISYFKQNSIENADFNCTYLANIEQSVNLAFSSNVKLYEINEKFKSLIPSYNRQPLTTISAMFNRTLLIDIIRRYEHYLELSHALDFNDLEYYANSYLKEPKFLEYVSQRYLYLIIDESQDTSFLEYSLLKKVGKYSIITLSGDFFQTIYEWRGSNPKKMLDDFQKCYNPCIFSYNINYRSTRNIALGSFSVLQNFFPLQVSDVYSDGIKSNNQEQGDPIIIKAVFDSYNEARFVNENVKRYDNNDSCVLVRTNNYAKELSYYLEQMNPGKYFLVEDYQYYKRVEVKEIVSFLKLIVNPYDTVSLERIALKYIKGFGEVKLARFLQKENYYNGLRLCDLLDTKTHDYDGDTYGLLKESLNYGNVVVFDTETTGLNINEDEVVQLACRKINIYGQEVDRFETLIRTNRSVGSSYNVHHISDEEIQKHGISKKEAYTKFHNFINGCVLVGHNVNFDISIMNSELEKNGFKLINNSYYDTLTLARRFIKGSQNYKLETLTKYLNLEQVGYHDAMEDVIATSNLLIYLVEHPIAQTMEYRVNEIKKYLGLFKKLALTIDHFRSQLNNYTFNTFVEDVVKTLNMEKVYQKNKSAQFNIGHFIKLSKLFSFTNETNYNCIKYIVNLASLSNNSLDAIYKENNLIPIITIHQSKGCEFENVYMCGVESGMYPAFYAGPKMADEEKRVFYVGITRAKKRLFLSYRTTKTVQSGHSFSVYPSVYLDYFDKRYIKII